MLRLGGRRPRREEGDWRWGGEGVVTEMRERGSET
jgi:hypothetical protein